MTAFGLTLEQHDQLGRLLGGQQNVVRTAPQPAASAKYRPPVRVISLETRSYNSRESTNVPLFRYDRTGNVWTVEMQGSTLAGYLVLVIDGQEFTVECRRPELDYVVARVAAVQRIEVLPGLWEIHLDPRSSATVTVRPITAGEDATLCELFDDVDTVVFNGSTIVRQEYWSTVRQSDGLASVAVTDAIPYLFGGIAVGSIGLAAWTWDAGYIVTAWQCREFSFAAGYVPADDPVPQDENDSAGSGGGDGPGDPDPEEPPPEAGEADWEWDGDFWVLTNNRCGSGYSPFAPVLPGFFVGQTGSAPCQL